jgi:small subunit ribosomal protein S1
VAQYGSTDSGASLGDILGAALSKAKKGDEDESDEDGSDVADEDDAAGEDESASEKDAGDKK